MARSQYSGIHCRDSVGGVAPFGEIVSDDQEATL